jgi:hypothetical protein
MAGGRRGQAPVGFLHPLAHFQTPQLGVLIPDLLTAGLHREVGLGEAHFRFARIAVHRDHVAGIPREKHVGPLDFRSLSGRYPLRDLMKLTTSVHSGTLACHLCLLYHIREVLPAGIP